MRSPEDIEYWLKADMKAIPLRVLVDAVTALQAARTYSDKAQPPDVYLQITQVYGELSYLVGQILSKETVEVK
jgi:hypothetical protein